MFTCKKLYSDIPFAHRQHQHDGHCSLIHGHNWGIEINFGCHRLDGNGFVIDFGRLKYLKGWIDEHLDHACLFNENDPRREQLVAAAPGCWKALVLPACSSEGIAEYLHEVFSGLVREQTEGRAFVTAVTVIEDSKNQATHSAESVPGR